MAGAEGPENREYVQSVKMVETYTGLRTRFLPDILRPICLDGIEVESISVRPAGGALRWL